MQHEICRARDLTKPEKIEQAHEESTQAEQEKTRVTEEAAQLKRKKKRVGLMLTVEDDRIAFVHGFSDWVESLDVFHD